MKMMIKTASTLLETLWASSQSLCANELVQGEMDKRAAEGRFAGKFPWYPIEDFVIEESARIVGGKPIEVTIMNTLIVNVTCYYAQGRRGEGEGRERERGGGGGREKERGGRGGRERQGFIIARMVDC